MSDDTTRRGRPTSTAVLVLVLVAVFLGAPGVWAQVPPCGDGTLDLGEQCDEGPATGQPDSCCAVDCTFRPALTPCRDAAGVCDEADVCSGTSGTCDDAKSTAACRPSAGVCDLGEVCDGVGDDCPADAFVAASFVCRPSAGICDVAEQCTGASAACPDDDFAPASVECRPAAHDCDAAEQCTGAAADCPADAVAPDETPCDDANVCSVNDRCIGGICGGFLASCGNGVVEEGCAEQCDDGGFEPGDGCDASCRFEPCGPDPVAGCRGVTVAGKAAVQIVRRLNPAKNRLQWKYGPGVATPKADFGDPTTDTSFQFCIYEEIGGDPRLAASYHVPAGGTCDAKPCWKESGTGFKYLNKASTPQGIAQLALKQGLADGKTKIILGGKGSLLPMPILPMVQNPDVVVQLKASNGVCWEARYATPAFRNQVDQFRDK